MPEAPAKVVITTVPEVNSARYVGSAAKTRCVCGESLKEPLPLMVNVATAESPVSTASPEKIVDSVGTRAPLTYTLPTVLNEPNGCFCCRRAGDAKVANEHTQRGMIAEQKKWKERLIVRWRKPAPVGTTLHP